MFRMSDDGPDLDEKIVFITTCLSCGWEDSTAYDIQGDCLIERCPECNSDRLDDVKHTQEFERE